MKLSLIVAMSENRVIGRDGQMPWHLSDELKRFRKLTTGHTIVMGRKTHESIGRALPDRRNIVVSRNPDYQPAEGTEVATSVDEAMQMTAGEKKVFITGGATLYEQCMSRADELHLTIIHEQFEGDTFLPEMDMSQWHLVSEESHEIDEKHLYRYTCYVYERAK